MVSLVAILLFEVELQILGAFDFEGFQERIRNQQKML